MNTAFVAPAVMINGMDIPVGLIVGIAVAALVIILLAVGYVKAPPDMVFIISGMHKRSRFAIGKATIRIPFFERLDKLNLRLIPIDVKTSNAVPTADYININVDATVNVKISSETERLHLAAENFLNRNPEYIATVAREVLEEFDLPEVESFITELPEMDDDAW